jgi:hypothetical protein
MLKTNKPDQEWIKRAREHTRGQGPKKHQKLKNKLLDIGGWAAVIPKIEEDLEKIMKRGGKFPGHSKTMKGQPCQCHSNSAFCWDENRNLCKICTGYALSRDGVWRQHSWVITNQGQLIETTEKRIQYYGYVMDHDECEEFFFRNM